MDDEGYLKIEEQLMALAVLIGVAEVMDNQLYMERLQPESPESLMRPRYRVIAKAVAIERTLSLLDRRTYDLAMDQIRTNLRQRPFDTETEKTKPPTINLPIRADVSMPSPTGDGEIYFDLRELPRLSEARTMLRELIIDLKEL